MIRAFRRAVGAFLIQTLRGFEFAIAFAGIINAHYTLLKRADGSAIAPYLLQGVRGFSYEPVLVSLLFGVFGAALLLLWFATAEGGGHTRALGLRAAAHSVLAIFYLAVTFAILLGSEPKGVCERYAFSAFVAMCCVACHIRLLIDRRAKGGHYAKGGHADAP